MIQQWTESSYYVITSSHEGLSIPHTFQSEWSSCLKLTQGWPVRSHHTSIPAMAQCRQCSAQGANVGFCINLRIPVQKIFLSCPSLLACIIMQNYLSLKCCERIVYPGSWRSNKWSQCNDGYQLFKDRIRDEAKWHLARYLASSLLSHEMPPWHTHFQAPPGWVGALPWLTTTGPQCSCNLSFSGGVAVSEPLGLDHQSGPESYHTLSLLWLMLVIPTTFLDLSSHLLFKTRG